MIIDTHCHFDMMRSPEAYIDKVEAEGNISIGMTNLPSHFTQGNDIVRRYKHIRLALGFHPLLIKDNAGEIDLFKKLIKKTIYIGEIGLDFSKEGVASKDKQITVLREILSSLQGQNKIISVHSKKAECELLQLLTQYNIGNVIFHWYSGPVNLIPEILDMGYYFSINEAMTLSSSGKKIIQSIPKDRILTETDAPYNRRCSIGNALKIINLSQSKVKENFNVLLNRINSHYNHIL